VLAGVCVYVTRLARAVTGGEDFIDFSHPCPRCGGGRNKPHRAPRSCDIELNTHVR